MIRSGKSSKLINWSKTACSPCLVYRPGSASEIIGALEAARDQHLTVIPHGAGHSYTDAALNSNAVVIDVTPMRRILAWDAGRGIMRVEPGVTLRDMVQESWKDGWWPYAAASTPEVTMGGSVAMNVNGKNAWKDGPFGAHVLSLDVLLASGETLTLNPERDAQLFHAFVGSLGLLGFITAVTVQLQRMPSGYVTMKSRHAASLREMFALFAEEEPGSDFMEAWLDGFAEGAQLGRGVLTSAAWLHAGGKVRSYFPSSANPLDRIETLAARLAARVARPVLLPGLRLLNQAYSTRSGKTVEKPVHIFSYTFWPTAAFAGYQGLFPNGVETFQAFVPEQQAHDVFSNVLQYAQQQDCWPVWCVIKQHRRDSFLLSYQVDGFSLELNFRRTPTNVQQLQRVLQHMIAMVVDAGGRFYLAKDHFLTAAQYRQSVGEHALELFLQLKQCYDPEMLLQSDLFRRLFRPYLS